MNDNSNTSNATGNQRKVQKQADALNRKQPKAKTKAMQAGARRYPEPPFPRQRHKKPGNEQAIDPPPCTMRLIGEDPRNWLEKSR